MKNFEYYFMNVFIVTNTDKFNKTLTLHVLSNTTQTLHEDLLSSKLKRTVSRASFQVQLIFLFSKHNDKIVIIRLTKLFAFPNHFVMSRIIRIKTIHIVKNDEIILTIRVIPLLYNSRIQLHEK